jgi:iron-sulfur cluster repair protein YtfE (RIC family)
MDKLIKASRDHEKISETFGFFLKSFHAQSTDEEENLTEKFSKFLDDYVIEHFKFEEREIFPLIMKKGMEEEKVLISKLEKQHIQIFKIVNQFKKLSSKCDLHPPEGECNKLKELTRKIIEMVFKHALQEDEELFPVLKKYEVNL